ncbi:GGDEF domain-containing protein [Teredinibacter turnerae]|uniref:GGDEF domain-containing protein n=1 Tax=Teredinibacter turnerae TaxID=2426 RepID=UPI00036FA4AB|nr:GGDEF domain-containing protein [Teredinibacter turnerae]
MVETAGGSYKEKYLQALADQERQEKQFQFQLEMLRKALNHLAAAAQGLDKTLDAELLLLKDRMRGASGHQVVDQFERVQKAVIQFERLRDSEHSTAAGKMRAMLEGLLVLQLPDDLARKVQSAARAMEQSLHNYRSYPLVLGEVTLLQQAALEAAMNPKAGFWQRLKGGRTVQSRAESVETPERQRKSVSAELTDENLQLAPAGGADLNTVPAPLKPANHLLAEDDFDKVAERICRTLRNLVESIEPNDIVRHKVDIVRARIQRGLDWFALAVTLDDLRDILMQRYLDVDREFSQYLLQVNAELRSISDVLGIALEQENQVQQAAQTLSKKVGDEVEKIHASLAASTEIQSLKQAVTNHLDVIHKALAEFHSGHLRAENANLSDQLQALLAKVESIESESSKTKELLEEERYRATHDSLTGLPNREAYNERVYQEYRRFTRYSRPLGIAVCDIDHFKKINDNFGHQTGDRVLKLIARLISTRLRKVDFVARYGGEEFVILLPETSASQSRSVLDKIRAAVAKAAFRFGDDPVKITLSFGISAFRSDDTIETAFQRADKALYQAKADGRNRCVVDTDDAEA